MSGPNKFEMRVAERTKKGEREVIFPCERRGLSFVVPEMPRSLTISAVSVWWRRDKDTLELIGFWNSYDIFVTKKGSLTIDIQRPGQYPWESD